MTIRYNDGYDYIDSSSGKDGMTSKILLLIVAVILPPLAVFFTHGFRGQFWINLLLVFFFYIQALIHAVWLIARR